MQTVRGMTSPSHHKLLKLAPRSPPKTTSARTQATNKTNRVRLEKFHAHVFCVDPDNFTVSLDSVIKQGQCKRAWQAR